MADPDIARITTWGAVEASNGIRTIAGTTDVDVTAADYTAGAALLTIEPVAGYPIRNVDIYLDLAKDTTGLIVVNTTETIGFVVQQKIDGANWQGVDAWPKAGESGILVPDAAGDLDADAWQGDTSNEEKLCGGCTFASRNHEAFFNHLQFFKHVPR